MAKLLLKSHGAVIKEIPLDKARLTIGRKPDNDVVLDDQATSGHHARVIQIQSVFFVEDAGSSNGTFANGKKTDRKQLVNGDQITVGQHTLVYQEDNTASVVAPQKSSFDADKTVVMTPELQRELLKAQGGKATASAQTKQVAVLKVVTGSTDQKEYKLTGPVAVIGSHDNATIKISGWFVPKRAALLNRQGGGYAVTMSEEGKKVMVNGTAIQGSMALKEGDLIEVAGVTLQYSMKEE
ncbi:MAG TPA: FHA domain-containing protein [Nitrospiraceae bacterium]|jgi:predicted component of type VI protein secretion system